MTWLPSLRADEAAQAAASKLVSAEGLFDQYLGWMEQSWNGNASLSAAAKVQLGIKLRAAEPRKDLQKRLATVLAAALPEGTMKKIVEFHNSEVGVARTAGLTLAEPDLRRVTVDWADEWVQRFARASR